MKRKTRTSKGRPNMNVAPTGAKNFCPLVALGASAGGLESFQQFFDRMPPDTGMSFLVIQHLDPHHETLMPELLPKHTSMPVVKVEGKLKAEPNTVYIITPNAPLSMEHCTLQVEPGRERMPIDHFFCSLAADQEEAVVGIIFSGTGTDGTQGLKAIKEHGGLTMAQSPESAKYDAMPRSAISSGVVDYVLPAGEMPAKVVEYVRYLQMLLQKRGGEAIQEEAPRLLKKIFPLLRQRTSHDFSRYKQSTVVRRLQRRMQLKYFDSVSAYIKFLREQPEEVDALFKDLLIGVTQFFRDPEAFSLLETDVIPELFAGKKPENAIRVWVPGCASGEEAYSIAILLAEHAATLEKAPPIQLFATDLDLQALDFARKGKYPDCIAEHLNPARLARYFRKRGTTYELTEEIRQMCLFSPHNLIKDPPFSRLDLISCRNLLIYLENELQKRVLPIFHYALNPAGYLFLGPSENLASRSELFRPVNKKQRMFQRRPSVLHKSVHLPFPDAGRLARIHTPLPPQVAAPREFNQARTIERVLLEDYAPASVIIDGQGEVVYFSGHTGKFLEPQVGSPTNKLINMARKNLRTELRTSLYRALTSRQQVVRENLVLKSASESCHFNLIVRPLAELGKDSDLFVVVFQEVIHARGASIMTHDAADAHLPIVQQLEHELRTVREDLQTSIEELESSNEDLKSANEELLSMNEEFQSTNEELQTSKEEVQSANDELQRKNDELDAANADLQNFFQNSHVPTVRVDADLKIKRFTPAFGALFRVLERDIGRPLPELLPELIAGEPLADKIRDVMRTQLPYERQFRLAGAQEWYIVRVNPYIGADKVVQGAMITCTDITAIKLAEREHNQLAAIVECSQDPIISKDLNGTITSWNEGARRVFGYTAEEALGKPILLIIPPDRFEEEVGIVQRLRRGERVESFETVRRCKDGRLIDVSLTISPLRDAEGTIIGASKIARDITEAKRTQKTLEVIREKLSQSNVQLEKQVQLRTAELVETNNQLEAFVYSIAHDLRAPLRSMQAFSSMLIEDFAPQLPPAAREYALRIGRAAESMDKLVLDLLAFGRVARADLELEEVEVAVAWAAAMAQNSQTIREKLAEIEAVSPLPTVRGHDATLGQCLANLLGNALKFVAPGRPPKVRFYAEDSGETVRLWLEDNGIGIAPEYQERIFRVFEQLNRTEYTGTGIGLSIVRKGVERMGGRVGVESALGQGSRFWIELPKITPPVPAG